MSLLTLKPLQPFAAEASGIDISKPLTPQQARAIEDAMDQHAVLVFRNPSGEPVIVPDDVATAGERAYRAYKAHLSGKSWQEIAVEEQYPSAEAVSYDVKRYMDEARSLVVHHSARSMLELEVARMDALQSFAWPQAERGHVPSMAFVLAVIKERARLVGLDPEQMNEGDKTNTVVVPKDSDGFISAMQRAAQEPPG